MLLGRLNTSGAGGVGGHDEDDDDNDGCNFESLSKTSGHNKIILFLPQTEESQTGR